MPNRSTYDSLDRAFCYSKKGMTTGSMLPHVVLEDRSISILPAVPSILIFLDH